MQKMNKLYLTLIYSNNLLKPILMFLCLNFVLKISQKVEEISDIFIVFYRNID